MHINNVSPLHDAFRACRQGVAVFNLCSQAPFSAPLISSWWFSLAPGASTNSACRVNCTSIPNKFCALGKIPHTLGGELPKGRKRGLGGWSVLPSRTVTATAWGCYSLSATVQLGPLVLGQTLQRAVIPVLSKWLLPRGVHCSSSLSDTTGIAEQC